MKKKHNNKPIHSHLTSIVPYLEYEFLSNDSLLLSEPPFIKSINPKGTDKPLNFGKKKFKNK